MTFNYAGMQARALALIQRFGRSMTLKQMTDGDYDSATLTVARTPTNTTVSGVQLGRKDSLRPGRLSDASAREILISASGLATPPKAGDQLVVGSDTLAILSVEPLSPAGTDLVYSLEVKR